MFGTAPSLSADARATRRGETDLRMVPLGFAALIAVGTILLRLPFAHQAGKSVGWLDALFLSASATCVTGLSTFNVAESLNEFGQVVVLLLIQAGGLGIFTASITLVLIAGRRLSLADEQAIHSTVGKLREARPKDVFIYACVFVFLLEFAGAVALFPLLAAESPDGAPGRLLWEAVFHSVSAFCNAGISIYPEGLVRWRNHPGILAILNLQVIAGGIGLMTLINLRYFAFWRRDPRRRGRLTLQTRLALVMAVALLVVGTVATMLFEWDHTLRSAYAGDRLSWALFHSTMTRTAGFNVVEVGEMNPPTLLVTLGLMFIGGAPGSMAGGVKTVTFAVLIMTAWSALCRREEVQFWGRRIRPKLSNVAAMVTLLAAMIVLIGVGGLMLTEEGQPASRTSHGWLAVVFEAVSAFCTVGLSTGITSLLTSWGKLIVIALMFLGRVAPLVLSVYLARPANPLLIRHPKEELALG